MGTRLSSLERLDDRITPNSVIADVTGDGIPDVVTVDRLPTGTVVRVAPGGGAPGAVEALAPAFEPGYTGDATVAVADLGGNGSAAIVVTAGAGGSGRVRILGYDGGPTLVELANFYGIGDPGFRGGASVAVADFNGDGTPDLAVAAGPGGGPRVAVYDGRGLIAPPGSLPRPDDTLPAVVTDPPKLTPDFFAFPDGPTVAADRGGLSLAAADVDGDGRADLIAAGAGGLTRVRVISGKDLAAGLGGDAARQLADFFVSGLGGGLTVSAAADGIRVANPAGGSQTFAYDSFPLSPGIAPPVAASTPSAGSLLPVSVPRPPLGSD